MSFETPILYLVFNRPDLVRKTFPRIREIKPKQLFIGADGSRKNHPTDHQRCDEVRSYLDQAIDWDCDVHKLYRNENLGCSLAVSGAITWFFEHVEMGIILEDDVLPGYSFFEYCEVCLTRYANDEEIMHVGGCNFNLNPKVSSSYFYSIFNESWGWATWRRAWDYFDFDIKNRDCYHEIEAFIGQYITDPKELRFWKNLYYSINEASVWDYQWTFCVWKKRGLTILPSVNLIRNVGFGSDATHTTGNDPRRKMHSKALQNITRPKLKEVNKRYLMKRNRLFFHYTDYIELFRYYAGRVKHHTFTKLITVFKSN